MNAWALCIEKAWKPSFSPFDEAYPRRGGPRSYDQPKKQATPNMKLNVAEILLYAWHIGKINTISVELSAKIHHFTQASAPRSFRLVTTVIVSPRPCSAPMTWEGVCVRTTPTNCFDNSKNWRPCRQGPPGDLLSKSWSFL